MTVAVSRSHFVNLTVTLTRRVCFPILNQHALSQSRSQLSCTLYRVPEFEFEFEFELELDLDLDPKPDKRMPVLLS